MTFTASKRQNIAGATPDSCAQRPTSSRSTRAVWRHVARWWGNRLRKRLTTALNLAATARWAEPEASARRAVQPTSCSPRAREGVRQRQASSAPSRGCSSCSVRQDDRHPARADHHLPPRVHGVRLCTSKPAQRCCWPRAGARFGRRSQPAPRRVFC